MNYRDVKKIKRLKYFKEKQRDYAASQMAEALQKAQMAEQAHADAVNSELNHLKSMKSKIGHSANPLDMELETALAQSLFNITREKKAEVNEAQLLVEKKWKALMDAHKEVKQMDSLKELWLKENKKIQTQKEQTELDNLTSVSGALK
jgi:flagellar export protein FliJ